MLLCSVLPNVSVNRWAAFVGIHGPCLPSYEKVATYNSVPGPVFSRALVRLPPINFSKKKGMCRGFHLRGLATTPNPSEYLRPITPTDVQPRLIGDFVSCGRLPTATIPLLNCQIKTVKGAESADKLSFANLPNNSLAFLSYALAASISLSNEPRKIPL